MAKKEGSQAMLLLVLLGLVSGAGAWNYKRNLDLEAASPRPYRSYSIEDLEALQSAYTGETERHRDHYRAVSSRKVAVKSNEMLDQQVLEFERVQRIGQNKRDIASTYAKNQVQLDEVQAEIAQRAAEGEGWKRHLGRLTRYP
jgi:hypothetical protein